MKKTIKRILITSVLTLGSLSLVGCNKDKEKDKDSFNFGNITTEVTTEKTTEESTENTTEMTTSTTTEVTTEEITTEEVKNDVPSYIVTDNIDTASIPNITVEGSETNPAKQGEWTQALKSAGTDEPKQTLYFRATDVARGEDAMAIIREYEANDGYFKFDDLGYDDLEYCVMTYQVYFPEGYLEEDWGISFSNLSFHVVDGDNAGTINNYIGMAQTYDISERVKNNTLYGGDVLERQVVFVMVKDYSDYMLYYRYYDDDYNEFTKYIACEKMSDMGYSEGTSTSVTTSTGNIGNTESQSSGTSTGTATKSTEIENGTYNLVGVDYNGSYMTVEEMEANSGQNCDMTLTVNTGICVFDASQAGDGLGRSLGQISYDGEQVVFTDGSTTLYGTYEPDADKITLDLNGKNMVFQKSE